MKNNEVKVIALGLITVLALAWIFTANRSVVEEPKEEQVAESNFTEMAFIEGCMDEGGDYFFCKCGYDEITRQIGKDGLLEMGMRELRGLTTLKDDDVIERVLIKCL